MLTSADVQVAIQRMQAVASAPDEQLDEVVATLYGPVEDTLARRDVLNVCEWIQQSIPRLELLENSVESWRQAAEQHHRNEQWYRGLLVKLGQRLGEPVYISDDGSVNDEPLILKVVEQLERLINRNGTAGE